MRKCWPCLLLPWVLFPLLLSAQDFDDFQVIVHLENPVENIPRSMLSKMMLKKKRNWKDGKEVVPVDLARGSSVRAAFTLTILGQSIDSIRKYWQKQLISGRRVPPPEMSDDDAVILFVQKNAGGIGYVSRQASLAGVKVISIGK